MSVLAFIFVTSLWFYLVPTAPDVTVDDVIGGVPVASDLAHHKRLMYRPQLIRVTESVYVAVGYAISNTIAIEGKTGLIVVDTTESLEAAAEILIEIRKVTKKPIRAIVYTHNHADHIQGTRSFIETPDDPPDIYAFHTMMELNHRTRVVAKRSARGAVYQFGVRLQGQLVDVGIGPRLRTNVTNAHLPPPPNKLIYKDKESLEIVGLNVTFLHVPGETADQIAVWIPDLRVLLPADDIYETFPNLYAIRGTPPRSSLEWLESIRLMRDVRPEYLVPSHTLPVKGEAEIYDLFTVYMHAIQYVHDQSVRLINEGLHLDEIAKRIQLPPSLSTHSYLQQFYGKTSWSAKAVYESYLGWFSGDPAELRPLTPKERGAKLIELIGRKELLTEAKRALEEEEEDDQEETQWALELSSHVYRLNEDDAEAKEVMMRALKALAAAETNPLARNYYLTAVLDHHHLLDWRINPDEVIRGSEMSYLFDLMRYRLKAEVATGANLTLVFNFTDVRECFRLTLQHSVLDVEEISVDHPMTSSDYDVRLTTSSQVWKGILTKELSPLSAYLWHRNLQVEGSVFSLRRFLSYLDREL